MAYASFIKSFDEDNLQATNDELGEILTIANFTHREKLKFIRKVKGFLNEKYVVLDSMRDFM